MFIGLSLRMKNNGGNFCSKGERGLRLRGVLTLLIVECHLTQSTISEAMEKISESSQRLVQAEEDAKNERIRWKWYSYSSSCCIYRTWDNRTHELALWLDLRLWTDSTYRLTEIKISSIEIIIYLTKNMGKMTNFCKILTLSTLGFLGIRKTQYLLYVLLIRSSFNGSLFV